MPKSKISGRSNLAALPPERRTSGRYKKSRAGLKKSGSTVPWAQKKSKSQRKCLKKAPDDNLLAPDFPDFMDEPVDESAYEYAAPVEVDVASVQPPSASDVVVSDALVDSEVASASGVLNSAGHAETSAEDGVPVAQLL